MSISATIIFFGTLLVLWALANCAVYAVWGVKFPSSVRRYFLQFGAAWNVINLSIGLYAVQFALRNTQELNSAGELATTQVRVIALNVFLDVLYVIIGTAVYLWRTHKRSSRRAGYGLSVMAQGLFLLAFDALFIASLVLAITD